MIKNKKIVIIFCILLVILLAACQDEDNNSNGNPADDNQTNSSQETNDIKFEKLTITSPGAFPKEGCKARGVIDKVIMLESKYCGHCKKTMPILQEACRERGIEPIIIDVTIPEQREQMESYGVQIAYTPTLIFGCDYYIGTRDKQGYLKLLDKFIGTTEK